MVSDTYKVIAGDTLYGIAKKLNTTISELKKINNLTNDSISIGQILKVPLKTVDLGDTELYQVKKGDTLYSIANKYGITLKELKAINSLTDDNLAIGQLLNVPSGLSLVNTYTVSSGDTLYSIAKKFGIDIKDIKEKNDLANNMLKIGQKLIIPLAEDTTYVVKTGDTLYGIAKKFNTTVDNLKKLNNLVDDILSVGKILILK